MLPCKLVEILDNEQKRKNLQYVDYMNVIKLADYHFFQSRFSDKSFSGGVLNNRINYYSFDPIKTSNPFGAYSGLLPKNPFEDKMIVRKRSNSRDDNDKNISKTKTSHIEAEINSISDLLKIIENNEYFEDTEYNVDLKALINIKEELVQLNSMIGLQDFKTQILNQILYFIQRLHVNTESDFMHTVLSGPPGSGKTEIATILGKMYSKIGILQKNIFKKVNRSDLVAGYLGQTAIKTNTVIQETLGGCLFIDEAYSLANNYEGDSFTRECIDTLCESLSKHKDELMVIIAGYKDELEQTFFKANKGMKSRFIWRFHLDKYNHSELKEIFIKKINENNWILNIEESELLNWFKTNYKNFKHYGRDVELLFSYVKVCHGRRLYGKAKEYRKHINLKDLENGFVQFLKNKNEEEINPEIFGLYV